MGQHTSTSGVPGRVALSGGRTWVSRVVRMVRASTPSGTTGPAFNESRKALPGRISSEPAPQAR